MKLKYDFVTNVVAGKTVAVAVGDDAMKFNGFIKMNDTGAEIFKLLKEDMTFDGLVEELLKIYPESDRETIESSTRAFIDKLTEAEVLV